MSIVLLSAGRRPKYLVILAVIVGAALLGSQAGKLDRVISTDPSESLPEGAESVAVLQAVRRFARWTTSAPPPSPASSATVCARRPKASTSRSLARPP